MVCEKCGTEMNTVYQHELQNISEKHLKYITVLGAVPFGFLAIWIFKRLWNKKDLASHSCPNCGYEYTIDPNIRKKELSQSNFLRIFGMVAVVVFGITLFVNVGPSAHEAKESFRREIEFMVVEPQEIKIPVGGKEKIDIFRQPPENYSFVSQNKKVATVSKKRVVTGKKVGTTTIKVYKDKNDYIGSVYVTVKKKGRKKK